MYKVLVADDEVLVRIGLRSMIDWEDNGFEIVGEAANGEIAYEKYQILQPDLVITDISMPRRDGFWLIDKIRRDDPDTAIIVLTCYDEFEFVRKALKYQVSEYLLKAEMEEQEILTIVKAKKEELDQKNSVETQPEIKPVTNGRDRLLGLLLNEGKSDQEVLDELAEKGIEHDGSRLCFLQMDFTDSLLDEKYDRDRVVHILTACCQLVDTHLAERFRVCITKPFGKSVTAVLGDEQLTEKLLAEELDYLAGSLKQYFSIEFKSANSGLVDDIPALRRSAVWFFEASDRLFYCQSGDHISQAGDISTGLKGDQSEKARIKNIIGLIEQAKHPEIEKILTEIRQSCIDRNDSSVNCKLRMVHLMDEVYHGCELYLQDLGQDFLEYQQSILEAENITVVFEVLAVYIEQLIEIVLHSRADNSEVLIGKAISYIDDNFQEKCSLEDVAGQVGISKYYLSNLFKKVKGINFSAYLNQVRIERARKLIAQPGMTVAEVCEQTGFNDQQYFSKTFKKYTGTTITEYRNIQARPSQS